jgi:hypothetical protein
VGTGAGIKNKNIGKNTSRDTTSIALYMNVRVVTFLQAHPAAFYQNRGGVNTVIFSSKKTEGGTNRVTDNIQNETGGVLRQSWGVH